MEFSGLSLGANQPITWVSIRREFETAIHIGRAVWKRRFSVCQNGQTMI